ncbi:MAG: AI-2E family transporter [bacterium]
MLLVVLVWFFYIVRGILLPFVASLMLSYLLNPLISHFEVKGIKRGIVILFFYLLSVSILVLGAKYLLPKILDEIASLTNSIPVFTSQIKKELLSIGENLRRYYPASDGVQFGEMIVKKTQQFAQTTLTNIPKYLMNIFSLFSLFILIPFITFFLLLDWRKINCGLFNMLPAKYVETVLCIVCEINEVLGGFMRGHMIRFGWITLISTVGLVYINLEYAIVLGVFVGLTNVVPYLGPLIGAIPIVIMAFFKYGQVMALKVIVVIAIVQLLDNLVVAPYVFSKSVKLHFILVLFAILSGAKIFGFMGVIFGVPIFSAIKVTLEILYNRMSRIDLRKVRELDSQKILLEQFKA